MSVSLDFFLSVLLELPVLFTVFARLRSK